MVPIIIALRAQTIRVRLINDRDVLFDFFLELFHDVECLFDSQTLSFGCTEFTIRIKTSVRDVGVCIPRG